jgi:hypothetical protein
MRCFAQLIEFLPWTSFSRRVARYGGDLQVRSLNCAELFRAMAFAQLTLRENLCDIEAFSARVMRCTRSAARCSGGSFGFM